MKPKRSNKRWTDEEIAFMKDYYGILSPKEIARRLGRSYNAVRNKAVELGLTKSLDWTDKEIALLKALYGRMPASEIAKLLGRSEDSVYHKAMRLGLKAYKLPPYIKDLVIKDTMENENI
ncbi:MAG: hypothetical protein DRI61_09580 [Chloroflexi bacterium]|nr:MAG: hypothetical protein DRI61_09580 [Chloroflexota bacterium]